MEIHKHTVAEKFVTHSTVSSSYTGKDERTFKEIPEEEGENLLGEIEEEKKRCYRALFRNLKLATKIHHPCWIPHPLM